MPKFFVTKEQIKNGEIEITDDNFNHIANVLRSKVGDSITFCDGEGTDFDCEIAQISKKSALAKIIKEYANEHEPSLKITLFQCLPKLDKMELVIQKCIEIGVDEIIPVLSENTVVKLNDKTDKKIERWNKIAESAAKQCGRGKIPKVAKVMRFKDAVAFAKNLDETIIPYEKEKENTLKSFAASFKGNSVGIFIGPEGGFADEEIKLAIQNNITPVTLGKRILRTETAGLVASVLLLYELEA